MDNIIDSIYTRITSTYKNSNDFSILTGSTGKILFLAYLYNATRRLDVKEYLENLIEHTIELITTKNVADLDFTYAGGITGFYWVINHIVQNALLFNDSKMLKNLITKDTELSISESLGIDYLNSKYDPLYGYIGKGIYFLSRVESRLADQILLDILINLKKDRIVIDNERTTWMVVSESFDSKEEEKSKLILGDCGQAHGITGIISFLCSVISRNKSKKMVKIALELLPNAVNWLLSSEIPKDQRSHYSFQATVNLTSKPVYFDNGRLGWCYGDNISAYALYRAAYILDNLNYRAKAEEISLNSCKVPVDRSGVIDREGKKGFNPTLCHGSAGIAMIYKKLYAFNKSPEILRAHDFWKTQTLSQTSEYLANGNLTSFLEPKQESCDFLYGYSGIGTYLITETYAKFGWEKSLLID